MNSSMENASSGRVGVCLLTMGEPETEAEVRPYLRQLLSDPDLVPFPVPLLQPVFAAAVSAFSGGRLRRALKAIGGGSPLVRLTLRQARALEASLKEDGDFKVYPVMRYGKPSARDAVRQMKSDGVRRVVAVPLYPQFCRATTGSSLKDLDAAMKAEAFDAPVSHTGSWPDHPGYICALCGIVMEALDKAPQERRHLLFCGHGIPLSIVEKKDPYPSEIEKTVSSVRRVFPKLPSSLAWQGKTGRGAWLEPSAESEVRRLAGLRVKTLLVLPVSFVSDHSETLWELDLSLKAAALEAGITTFLRVPALNDAPTFTATLRDLTLSVLS
ncbi:MAG: ferrochelatase [Elusimicrobia bacterium]|nr:ferrochelatase [Elusimicrobiota bacterium]